MTFIPKRVESWEVTMITSKQKRCSKACVSVAALLQAVTLHSNNNLLATAFVFQPIIIHPLIQPSPSRRQTLQPYNYKCVVPLAANNKWSQDIEENSRRRAAGGAGETGFPGETFAGAVLGGLLGGPFGALFGATIGSNIGSRKALDRARQDEMARIGISEDMLVAAQELGETLERANQGLITVQDSLSSLQSFARRLDLDANEMYEKAKVAMAEKDENKAKKLLLDRHATMEKLKGVLKDCAEMKNRMETMEQNVSVLERKAIEMETLLKRSVGAKALQDSGALGLSLQDEDPLLRKFRDLGID